MMSNITNKNKFKLTIIALLFLCVGCLYTNRNVNKSIQSPYDAILGLYSNMEKEEDQTGGDCGGFSLLLANKDNNSISIRFATYEGSCNPEWHDVDVLIFNIEKGILDCEYKSLGGIDSKGKYQPNYLKTIFNGTINRDLICGQIHYAEYNGESIQGLDQFIELKKK